MEATVYYTDCTKGDQSLSSTPKCSDEIKNQTAMEKDCNCNKIIFNVTDTWDGDVFIYYELENFYQNHRRYVKSRDDKQLLGKLSSTVNTDCSPFDKCKNTTGECKNGENNNLADGSPFLPCGAIANSLFSGKLLMIWTGIKSNHYNNTNTKTFGKLSIFLSYI